MSDTNKTYWSDWESSGRAGMLHDFGITEAEIAGAEILFATYTYEDYNGSAFVLFRKDGQLFEVNGGHCSCNGLEDQWEPEATTIESVTQRKYGYLTDSDRIEVRKAVAQADGSPS